MLLKFKREINNETQTFRPQPNGLLAQPCKLSIWLSFEISCCPTLPIINQLSNYRQPPPPHYRLAYHTPHSKRESVSTIESRMHKEETDMVRRTRDTNNPVDLFGWKVKEFNKATSQNDHETKYAQNWEDKSPTPAKSCSFTLHRVELVRSDEKDVLQFSQEIVCCYVTNYRLVNLNRHPITKRIRELGIPPSKLPRHVPIM